MSCVNSFIEFDSKKLDEAHDFSATRPMHITLRCRRVDIDHQGMRYTYADLWFFVLFVVIVHFPFCFEHYLLRLSQSTNSLIQKVKITRVQMFHRDDNKHKREKSESATINWLPTVNTISQ